MAGRETFNSTTKPLTTLRGGPKEVYRDNNLREIFRDWKRGVSLGFVAWLSWPFLGGCSLCVPWFFCLVNAKGLIKNASAWPKSQACETLKFHCVANPFFKHQIGTRLSNTVWTRADTPVSLAARFPYNSPVDGKIPMFSPWHLRLKVLPRKRILQEATEMILMGARQTLLLWHYDCNVMLFLLQCKRFNPCMRFTSTAGHQVPWLIITFFMRLKSLDHFGHNMW